MHSIVANWHTIVSGALYTLGTAGFGVVVSLIIGTILGVASAMRVPVVSQLLAVYTEIIRNTPELVQLFWIFLVLPFVGIQLSVVQAVLVYLCVNGIAYVLVVVRGGVQAVPVGQHEASRALGLTKLRMYRRILVPQALSALTPSLVNEVIRVLKNTTLVSLIAAPDLVYQVTHLANITFEPIAFQLLAAVFYFVVITLLSIAARRFAHIERARV